MGLLPAFLLAHVEKKQIFLPGGYNFWISRNVTTRTEIDALAAAAELAERPDHLFGGFKIFIFFLIAFFIVCLLVFINWVIINFKSNNRKNSPYECGFEPVGSPISDFTPNFTSVALIFLIYDVEVLLTFPWAYTTAGHSASALAAFFFFVCLMVLGLAYEVLDDSFNVV